ncbi:MAG: hypothetical protein NWE78_05640, partial [Candidatus Bathyarchaeota archaeon]|nr:hypothetical protein [Candidatus Bathyarchaeota archaeon]
TLFTTTGVSRAWAGIINKLSATNTRVKAKTFFTACLLSLFSYRRNTFRQAGEKTLRYGFIKGRDALHAAEAHRLRFRSQSPKPSKEKDNQLFCMTTRKKGEGGMSSGDIPP